MAGEELEYSIDDEPNKVEPRSYAAYEVPFYAVMNAPSSAYKFGKGIKETLIDPIYDPEARQQLVEGVKQVGTGVYSKARGLAGYEQDPQQKAAQEAALNAIAEDYKNKYGGWENIKRSIAEDPFGTAMDVSGVATLGGGTVATLPGKIGQVGKIVKKVGEVTDPLKMATGIGKTATAASAIPLWWKSGASYESLLRAAQAGEKMNPEFLRHMSGFGKPEEIIDSISNAISRVADEKNAVYQRGMGSLNANVPANYNDIFDAWRKQYDSAVHLGKVYDQATLDALNRAGSKIYEWSSQPNVQGAHNVFDMDKLKRAISEIRKDYPINSPAGKALTEVRKSIYNTIENIDPKYAKVMEDYQSRLDELNDLRYGLGANKKDITKKIKTVISAQKTAAGKDLIKRLEEIDPDLPFKVAGQELSDLLPYGIRGYLSNMATGVGAGIVPAAAGIIASSPKVAGTTQYALGAATRALPSAIERRVPQMARGSAYGLTSVSGATIPKVEEEKTKKQEMPLTDDLEYTIEKSDGGQIDRVGRADGGRISVEQGVRALMRAVEDAKKSVTKSTENLLQLPDEHVAQTLDAAKRHI